MKDEGLGTEGLGTEGLGTSRAGASPRQQGTGNREQGSENGGPEQATNGTSPPPLDRAPLAYENTAFLNSAEGRLIRIVAEYVEPLARFRKEQIQDTVVFFGSARFRDLHTAETALSGLKTGDNAGSEQETGL